VEGGAGDAGEAAADAASPVGRTSCRSQRTSCTRCCPRRAQRGAIEFESSEVRFVLDNRGEVTQAGMLVRNDAHKLIEECMIAANVEARVPAVAPVPAPYRATRSRRKQVRRPAGIPQGVQAVLPPWSKVRRATSPSC
jgi:hypothetical protein